MKRIAPGLALLMATAMVLELGTRPAGAEASRMVTPTRERSELIVVDSADRVVGRLGYSGREVAMRIRGRVVIVVVSPARIRTFGVVGFESAGCQGPPLIVSDALFPGAPLFHSQAGIGPGQILLGGDGPPENRQIASVFDPGDATPCQDVTPEVREVYRAVELLDLGAFTPPFRVR